MIKQFITYIIIFTTLLATNTSFGQQSEKGVVVIELFTSQGDINCPTADKLLTEIIADAKKNNKQIYGLSMHVDFWNRLGWTDPFSNIKYTRRLQNYSSVLNETETYTPKFIINGKSAGKNSNSSDIKSFITKEISIPKVIQPSFTYQVFQDTLDLSFLMKGEITKNKSGSNWYVNVAIVENHTQTKVTKGDNVGKTLVNSNVVKLFYTTNLNKQEGLLRIPLKGLKKGEGKTIILFVQEKKSKIVGGATSKVFE